MKPQDPQDSKGKSARDGDPIQIRIRAGSIVATLASWHFSFRRRARIKPRTRRVPLTPRTP
ncbi:MAG TPA: hypothetical protein VFH73_13835 [Polyangia bacterium]|jgi:hypothetical protein|nr:hypothetical protein [Polyangia bacterium]